MDVLFVWLILGGVVWGGWKLWNMNAPNTDLDELKKKYNQVAAQIDELKQEYSDEYATDLIMERVLSRWPSIKTNRDFEFDVEALAYYFWVRAGLLEHPNVDFSQKISYSEILDIQKYLAERKSILDNLDSYIKSNFVSAVVEILEPIIGRTAKLPYNSALPIPFKVDYLSCIHSIKDAINDLLKVATGDTYDQYIGPPTQTRDILFHPCFRMRKNFNALEEVWPLDRKNKNKTNKELIKDYLQNSGLDEFLTDTALPFTLPQNKRQEHTHIVGGSGHGKTQLLQNLIYNDLEQAQKDPRLGLCVIDSQGDLINTLLKLRVWDSDENGQNLLSRLVLIDPSDTQHPPCLNLFDLNLGQIKDPTQREMAINSTISLYQFIFADLVDGKLTMYQENIFQNCSKLLLSIEGSTLMTFLDLLNDIGPFRGHIRKLDPSTRQFFESEYSSNLYAATKQQLLARLRRIATNSTLRNMFDNPVNKVDMFGAMNTGKIVLINTSKMLLQSDGAKMLGKFFIALILQSVFQRAFLPEGKRNPFMLYVDEAQDYLNDQIAEFFEQARKYNVSLTIAHQHLKQLDQVSTALRHSVLTNTSIKLIGNAGPDDARILAERVFCNKEDIYTLQKWDRKAAEFMCHVKDITRQAVKIRVPFGELNGRITIDPKAIQTIKDQNHQLYCRSLTAVTPAPPRPTSGQAVPLPQHGPGPKGEFKIGKRKSL